MMQEKVGIVITTCQREPWMLLRAVTSVLKQTYTNWKMVIVDDSSHNYAHRDRVSAAIKDLSDKRISFIQNETNIGACASRNKGALCCNTTTYLAFLDDDDEWVSNKLEKMIPYFISPSIGLVYASAYLCYCKTGKVYNLSDKRVLPQGNIFSELLQDNVIGSSSFPILRRKVFEEVGGFCESLGALQDWELWIRIAIQYEVAFINCPLTRYHFHNEDRISLHPERRLQAFEYIHQKYRDNYMKSIIMRSYFFIVGSEFYAEANLYKKAMYYFIVSLMLNPFKIKRNKKAFILLLNSMNKKSTEN